MSRVERPDDGTLPPGSYCPPAGGAIDDDATEVTIP